jgi:eukaryotic-like serine/threonine-protein kinase
MPLEPGSRLGTFEVLSRLGAGGMGEVWRARDTRLQRDVAIKVLPDAFAQDADRLQRFTREAHVLASLNHPNIAAIYSFEEVDGLRFLVLELVSGETLKQRIARAPVSVNEVIRIALQIADALEAAHAKGVLHRDLKPANVNVTPEGKVKLLDFGLAKAFALGAASPEISHSPTIAADATHQGVVLGTASYMSPEQARSRTLDARSDLWAFGCVLYEMLARRKAFDGETVSDILVAILDREPGWAALPSPMPAPLLDLLKRLLQKDPANRPGKVQETRAFLEAAAGSRSTAVFPALSRPASRAGRLAATAAAVAVLAGGATLALRTRPSAGALPREKYLAILPFKDLSGRPEGQVVVDGIADSFGARLTKVPGLMVMSSGRGGGGVRDDAEIARFARERGANLLLQCSYRSQGDTVRLTYRLLSPSSLAILAGDEVEGATRDQFALEDRLFENVLSSLRLQVGHTGAPAAASAAVVAQRPSAGEPYFRALGLLQRYDDPKALASAIDVLSAIPDGARSALVQAALSRGLLERYRMAKDPEDASRARAAVERAIALDDRLPESHLALGQLLLQTGRPKDAVDEIRKALERQARSADATLLLGDALAKSGAPAEAEAVYREAIALNPDYWAGYSKLAGVFYQRGDMPKALELFRTAAEKYPSSPRVHSNVGAVLLRLGRVEEAEAAFRSAVDLAPDANAWSNLGTSQYLARRFTDAAVSFEKAVDLAPHEMRYRVYLADAYWFAPELKDRAALAYGKGLELSASEERIHPLGASEILVAAKAEVRTGHAAQAAQSLQRALALEPGNPTVLFRAALIENALGHGSQAVRLLEQAVGKGFAPAQIARDPELFNLKDDPDYRALVGGVPPAAAGRAGTP